VSDETYNGWGELTEFYLTNPLNWKLNVIGSIREMHDPTLNNPSFHVAVTVHGRSFTDKQIDLLSVFGYVIRLGAGSKSPHDPVVVSRFVDLVADGVEYLDQAVERAHYEVSALLEAGQDIFAVHAMTEERWDECEACREDTLNERVPAPSDEFVLDAPPRTGNRRSTLRFLENLPADLTGKRVTVNVEGCWATTSFVHETMLGVVTHRNADRLTFVGASNEFAELAHFCAKDDDTLLKRVFLGESEIIAPDESDSEDILDTLDRWLVDDEFCENTNAEILIAAAVEEIKQLREAGDDLANKMRSGSDSGWDDAIDKWEELR
jgi:hypothetical protein